MTNLSWENFEPLFGTWAGKIKPFFDKGGFDNIYKFLKHESKRGKLIAPLSENVFKCFTATPLDEMCCVLCGFSPYHSLYGKTIVADGLLMGCSITKKLQPSLEIFYDTIHNEMYPTENFIKTPDVSYLAEQGVLMLNLALSTEIRKAGNHVQLWEPFIKFLFEEVINITGAPIILLGKEAAQAEKYTMPLYGSYIFKISHPASAAYSGLDWSTEGAFKKANEIIKYRHGKEINWLYMIEPF